MSVKIDYKKIIKIIDLLEERNLSHFELEVEGFKIKISRGQPNALSPESRSSSPPAFKPQEKSNPLSQETVSQEKKDNLYYITSPMVGTFYRSPDPTSSPFVDIGDTVKKAQTLCIIEAMKLMNEIESDVDGLLKEAYVENGKPVEYGQKLFAIQLLS